MTEAKSLLEIRDLQVKFRFGAATVHAVNHVDLDVRAGETTAILGESGSGKSVTASAIMRLVRCPPGSVTASKMRFKDHDILQMDQDRWRRTCGVELAMVFQDSLASLNPVFSVGWQIAELFRMHQSLTHREAGKKAVDLLASVGIPDPKKRAAAYPHQFSGGMRQRAMIAMAIALGPDLLIADEPTTALDVTVQAQIMDLLDSLQRESGMAMMLITHDLGVVADVADTVHVMYAGRVVEAGVVSEVMSRPAHPYTLALMESVPQAHQKGEKLRPIKGSPPDLARIPRGCAFRPRCRFATDICAAETPADVTVAPGRTSQCHHAREIFDGR